MGTVRLRSRLLPALLLLLLLAQAVVPYRGWTLLLAGLGATWLLAWVWARSLARGLELTREMRFGWAQVGDRLEERFTVRNRGWAPALWVEVLDHSTMPDYQVSRVTDAGPAGMSRWQTSGLCTRRGLFTLGPTTLRSSDPFGLYTVTIPHPAVVSLMVTPPVLPLPHIEVAPGGRTGDGRPRPFAAERSALPSGVRPYVPGDPPRWIHWPTSARTGTLHVKLFDSAPVGDWWVILDMAQAAQAGEGMRSTEEHAIILAASLADRGLRAGHRVGLLAQGEEALWLPPRGDPGQPLRLLRALALLSPGTLSLEQLLARARPALGQQASLILITPAVGGEWVPALLPLLRRGAVPTVLLLDPLSFGGEGSATATMALLTSLGIAHSLVSRDLLDRPEAQPGQRGSWEWKVLGTGRVIARRRPRDLSWRELG